MAPPHPLALITDATISISLPEAPRTFHLALDGTNVTAWTDFLKYLLEHPEVIMAFLQLIAMLLGGLTPPPPKP